MTSFASRFVPLLVLLAALAEAPTAHARNESFKRPVDPTLARQHTREILGELRLRFGSASANGADLLTGDVFGQGEASIIVDPRSRVHLSDEEVCQKAFDEAIAQLAQQAHQAGAAAVVGIVSEFKGEVFDDPHSYDCHAGSSKSYVTLRGKFARTYADPSTRPLPPATAFADLADVGAVPISEAGRERYAHFLTLPKPRAFVVYEDGNWRFYSKDPEAMTKALDYCAREGRRCWLYAADDRVVWSADANQRIGSSTQLGGGAVGSAAVKDEHQ